MSRSRDTSVMSLRVSSASYTEKLDFMPSVVASRRSTRTHIEWNVDTHMALARRPTSSTTRSRISAAALLVNVIAMIWPGCTSRSASR
jgi:hypothetical protein